jgi:DhnA family fructose-bisphosphate aldolase class Ia
MYAMGKAVRLSRMVNAESNKMMAITVDHATSRGIAPMTGIQDIQGAIDKIVAGRPDAMTMTGGIQKRCWGPHVGSGISILHKISNYAPTSPTNDVVFGAVDAAVRMGADAVSMGCITLGIGLDKTSNDVLFWWFTILCFLGITTWKICSGKTIEEIKEFTGINFAD